MPRKTFRNYFSTATESAIPFRMAQGYISTVRQTHSGSSTKMQLGNRLANFFERIGSRLDLQKPLASLFHLALPAIYRSNLRMILTRAAIRFSDKVPRDLIHSLLLSRLWSGRFVYRSYKMSPQQSAISFQPSHSRE